MPENRDIRKIWRLIARGLGFLEPAERAGRLKILRENLFPFLPAFEDGDHPVTLAKILEQENSGLTAEEFEFRDRAADPDSVFGAWDTLYRFELAVNEKAPGLPARELWDAVADSGGLSPISGVLGGWVTIAEALEREEIEVLPQRGAPRTFDPPPLANPPDLLGRDTKLVETSPDYAFPIPEDSGASHRVLKLGGVMIIGADVPAPLGGGIPVSLAEKIVPDAKGAGNGYAAGDIPAGLLAYLFARDGVPTGPAETIDQAFLLPGAGIPDNHFHGIIDSLPSLRHYLELELECPIVIPKLGRGIRALLPMVLDHYRIPEERIWSQEKASRYRIEEAIMPPRHGIGGDLSDFYRPLAEAAGAAGADAAKRRYPSRIYLRRGTGGSRALANEAAIETAMERFGFRVLTIWNLPMKEQITHLANAEIVAGPFGAGLTNLVFAKRGTRVIEILNHKNFEELGVPYKRISDACGLEHYCVVPDSLFESASLTPPKITISMRRLDEILKRLAPAKDFRSRFRVWKHDLATSCRRFGKRG